MNNHQPLFYCDHCLKKNEDGKYTCNSFYQKQKFLKHIETKKHLDKVKNSKDEEPSFYCKHCNCYFNSWAWDLHREKNEKLWQSLRGLRVLYGMRYENYFKELSCNNFVFKNKRYSSFNDLIEKNDLHIPHVATPEQVKKDNERIKRLEELKKDNSEIKLEDGSTIQKKFTEVKLDYCMDCGGWINEYNYTMSHIEFQYIQQLGQPSYMTKSNLEKFRSQKCSCEDD